MEKDLYQSIGGPAEGLYKELGSRFIARAYPVETEEDVKGIVASLRREYHDARHVCYAYRLGPEGAAFRSTDDGEPSGTAGRPILGQIDAAGLSDVLVVVVRYFGGIKLGVPGLARAYKAAAADALAAAAAVPKVAAQRLRVEFDYLAMNEVMRVLKEMALPVLRQEGGARCALETAVPRSAVERFRSRLGRTAGLVIAEV